MSDPNFIILYVDSPVQSAAFYSALFEKKPLEESRTFALFVLENGTKFGLWSKHTVLPAASAAGGGCEVGFSLSDDTDTGFAFFPPPKAAVDALYSTWAGRGVTILQEPTQMDFGYTFVATDPGGASSEEIVTPL